MLHYILKERGVLMQSKSFYYTVEKSNVDEYKTILDLMKIPYQIEKPVALLKNGSDEYKFVFPNLPARLYAMVSKLFQRDGKPYSST
ncbi:hypothetical protein EDM52_02685 [Brevibacillus invocatus]|uniref:Homing endonuclease LAGLIDADG domain-containing protein n=2 Tax=Brevibacillus invocatus TaxID=173959 RepID=A0A3M8CMQ2_9BACL|nr:hypothetical protein EDM52_02685 [Brevibacillus invocatus]